MLIKKCNEIFIYNLLIHFTNFKADLQTSTQIIALSSHKEEIKELQPNKTIDEVIHHEVKEIGTHM